MTRNITSLVTTVDLAGLASVSVAQKRVTVWRTGHTPVNAEIAGSKAAGRTTLTVDKDRIAFQTEATGILTGIMQFQRFYGFTEGHQLRISAGQIS